VATAVAGRAYVAGSSPSTVHWGLSRRDARIDGNTNRLNTKHQNIWWRKLLYIMNICLVYKYTERAITAGIISDMICRLIVAVVLRRGAG
jgi:hypothetical protein